MNAQNPAINWRVLALTVLVQFFMLIPFYFAASLQDELAASEAEAILSSMQAFAIMGACTLCALFLIPVVVGGMYAELVWRRGEALNMRKAVIGGGLSIFFGVHLSKLVVYALKITVLLLQGMLTRENLTSFFYDPFTFLIFDPLLSFGLGALGGFMYMLLAGKRVKTVRVSS